MLSTDTLERIIPDHLEDQEPGWKTLSLHLERYRFAAAHLKPGRVLDIACGVGYGAHELVRAKAQDILSITGVDLSSSAIAYAQQRYTHPKVSFVREDAQHYKSSEAFDTIICLETIEHLPDPFNFIGNLCSMLSKNGKLIASVPVTYSTDVNPYHLTDFTVQSFYGLFKHTGLRKSGELLQVQSYNPVKLIRRQGNRSGHLRPGLPAFYLAHPLSFIKRLVSILQDGFSNKYLTVAFTNAG